ncbi:Rv3654c family TadE-like protein [Streptomyces populi]
MRNRSRRRRRRYTWSPAGNGRRSRWRASSDRGSATVWTVGAIAVLCAVFGAVLSMGQAVVVRHRAAGAADLAALAAADHWSEGGAVACARADRVVRAQSARLVRCEVEGQISDVTASSGTGPITAEVRSRAGPAAPADPAGPSGPPRPPGPVGSTDPPGSGPGPVDRAGSTDPPGPPPGSPEPAGSASPPGSPGSVGPPVHRGP